MLSDVNTSFFSKLSTTIFVSIGRQLSSASLRKATLHPFKDHPQLGAITDILSRKYRHHLAIQSQFSSTMYNAFIEALLYHLCQDNVPYTLQYTELLYLDATSLLKLPPETLLADVAHFSHALDHHDKSILIFIDRFDLLENNPLSIESLRQLFQHPKSRIITHTTHSSTLILPDVFVSLRLESPMQADILALLKQQRTELEHYHHVVIPDELLSQAYMLAERYIHSHEAFDNALLLLDSCAARASTHEKSDQLNQSKPIVTLSLLTQVLSNWTQIPAAQLQPNKFKLPEFIQSMQQRVYGQDLGLSQLGHEVQQAHARLQDKNGPFLSFLFAGPKHAGKMTTAIALAQQLFKKNHLLFSGQPTLSTAGGLAEIRLQRHSDKQYIPLNKVMQQTPYAVIVIENIEHASLAMLDGLYEILATGHLQDANGNQVSFRHAILIICTTLGSSRTSTYGKLEDLDQAEFESMNLMDLVMSDHKPLTSARQQPQSSHHIIQEMLPEITSYLPATLCQHLQIIPFLPLTKTALDPILRLKLKKLGTELENRYGIELSYAPEVIRFLIHDMHQKSANTHDSADIDGALKQLYACIEQAILTQAEQKTRSHQLFLQLNETGQTLRYNWLTLTSLRQHAT
jgi:ATP-dependent Clp protease ATP-binding subunit ClpA